MNVDQQHIIRTVRYEILLDNEKVASEVQTAVSMTHRDEVNGMLETLLNSHTKEGMLYQFDTVTVDLGVLNLSNYKEMLPSKIEEALQLFLAESITENSAPEIMSKVSTSDANVQKLEHFLRHGYLPWNSSPLESPSTILANILATNSDTLNTLLSTFSQNENVQRRLASQFSEYMLQRLTAQLREEATNTQEIVSEVNTEIETYDSKRELVNNLFKNFKKTEALVKNESYKKLGENMERQFLNPVYVNHAGLVIVAPYLGMLFSKLELAQNNEFVNPASQQRAVQLLGYVATGSEKIPEHELLISKMLCGMLAAEPLVFTQPLTEAEMKMADEMLGAIIQHWTAIQNTSIQGLRESFIMRDGKLEDDEDAFYLKVEQKSFDMLLDQIPWNIGKIKLSWMQKIVEVIWR